MSLFPEKLLTPPQENELEITIFGPGYGESIVVHVPEIGWGVIDSCVTKTAGIKVTLPLDYLLNILTPPNPKLAFVVLTHPHEDHYRGLDQILREYPGGVKRVCRYNGHGTRDLKMYLIRHQRIGWTFPLPGLLNVFRSMDEAVRAGSQPRNLGEMTTVFDKKDVNIDGFGETDISMLALSPSATSSQKYVEKLFSMIPMEGKPLRLVDDKDHNLISVALLLKLGDLQIIFGSDLESGSKEKIGWIGVISHEDCPDLWANLVKVAHHGSENGFNDLVWRRHCKKSKPLAVITPYVNANTLLPKHENVEKLKNFSDKVGITGDINLVTNLHQFYPRDVVRSISYKIRSMKIIESPSKIGFIRTRFLLNGTITECHAEPSANWA